MPANALYEVRDSVRENQTADELQNVNVPRHFGSLLKGNVLKEHGLSRLFRTVGTQTCDTHCHDLEWQLNVRRWPSAVRKYRPFAKGWANWSNRPFSALQDRAYERAGRARKRTSAEFVDRAR